MLHTIDPTLDAADAAIRNLLQALDDKPVRYENTVGQVANTNACRGLCARYVLIDAAPDAVHVGAIRLGLGTGTRGFTTRQHLRQPAVIAYPDGTPTSLDGFAHLLAIAVGMALDDIERTNHG